MLNFKKIAPVLLVAAGLLPLAAYAGPVAGRLPGQVTALSQGHLAVSDSLAGSRQAGYPTQAPVTQTAQASGLSQGHFSNTDPLAGERQQGPANTAG